MDDALRAEIEVSADHVTMRLFGSLCLTNEERLQHYFDGVLAARIAPGLTVDLRGVEFIDSTGVRGLLALRSRAIAAATEVTFRSGPATDRLFRLLDLMDVFCPGVASDPRLAGPAVASGEAFIIVG